MKIVKGILKYSAALAVGYVLGMQLQQLFEPKNPVTQNRPNPAFPKGTNINQTTSETQENDVFTLSEERQASSFSESAEPRDDNPSEIQTWSASELIDHFKTLDKKSFFDHFMDDFAKNVFEVSPDLVYDLLDQYLDIQHATARAHVADLLMSVNWQNGRNEFGFPTNPPIEKWVLDQIKMGYRQSEWLATIGAWGVNSREGISYMGNILHSLPDVHDQKMAITALAMSMTPEHNAPEAHKNIVRTLQPYLESQDDGVRAAAVHSLRAFAGEKVWQQLESAITDPAQEVRLRAIMVINNRHFKSPKLKALLLATMSSKHAAPVERLSSFQTLSIFSLTGDDYDEFYEFSQGAAQELHQQFLQAERDQAKRMRENN